MMRVSTTFGNSQQRLGTVSELSLVVGYGRVPNPFPSESVRRPDPLMGEHEATVGVVDRDHPIAVTRRLNVLAAEEGIVHAPLYLGLKLVDEERS
jgi:hypothetical protein